MIVKVVCLVLLLPAVIEIVVRISGIIDFPVYAVDDEIGYIVRPNQHGNFLRTHAWEFNDKSMGTASPWNPAKHPNVLLIGNSVIMGGNPYDQKEKVGPLMQQGLGSGYSVWPIATGGWSTVNEMAYLDRNKDVVQSADFFVWEYMSGGLSSLSRWRGQYIFPRKRPVWGGWYVFRRYILPKLYQTDMNELPPSGAAGAGNLKKFEEAVAQLSRATKRKCPGILFLYPEKAQFLAASHGQEWLAERAEVERIAKENGIKVMDIAHRPEWNEALYRDPVHPSAEGNAVLARILAAATAETFVH